MLADLGANIRNILDVDPLLWQLLEEFWYAVEHTFQGSPVFKMWENSQGVGLFQALQMVVAPAPRPSL